jgi:hypothetical protein
MSQIARDLHDMRRQQAHRRRHLIVADGEQVTRHRLHDPAEVAVILEQGLDEGQTGATRARRSPGAKANTEGLADADYFTLIKANGRNVKFKPPQV